MTSDTNALIFVKYIHAYTYTILIDLQSLNYKIENPAKILKLLIRSCINYVYSENTFFFQTTYLRTFSIKVTIAT